MRLTRSSALPLLATSALLGALTAAGAASAHVDAEADDDASPGETTLVEFSFSHGCDGSPTTALRIQMPESIPAVAPTINANWTVSKAMAPLDTPITDAHGNQITERVAEVVYTAITPVEDGYRDVFELQVKIPDDAADTTIYFPVIQTCEAGETAWIEIPADGQSADDLESPAPSIRVDDDDDDDADGQSADHDDDEDDDDDDDSAAMTTTTLAVAAPTTTVDA